MLKVRTSQNTRVPTTCWTAAFYSIKIKISTDICSPIRKSDRAKVLARCQLISHCCSALWNTSLEFLCNTWTLATVRKYPRLGLIQQSCPAAPGSGLRSSGSKGQPGGLGCSPLWTAVGLPLLLCAHWPLVGHTALSVASYANPGPIRLWSISATSRCNYIRLQASYTGPGAAEMNAQPQTTQIQRALLDDWLHVCTESFWHNF